MRRLIAYIITALAMLLAVGVCATPVITKLNAGREYTSGRNYRELTFRVEKSNDDTKNDTRAQTVADEMRTRLNDYQVEDYSIKVQGEDTLSVALNMSSNEYNYAAKYLLFSGESFALVSSKGTVRNEHKLFNAEDIKIEYKGDAKVPVIVIPVTEEGKQDVKDLVKEFHPEGESEGEESKSIKRPGPYRADGEGEGEAEQPQNLIYLWANFDDERGEELASLNSDPIAREKVLMAFNADNIWYEDSKEEETELFYMCARGKEDNQQELDISGLKDDNARANYLVQMLKAKKYEFEISCPTVTITESSVDYFENAKVLSASSEALLTLGNNVNVKMSKTFITIGIAVVIISLLLIVYYRLSALGMIATTLGTVILTLVSFTSMHVLFNTAAIVGFICLVSLSLFGQIVYLNRFKEEVYKGRSIKKANQEASKRSNLLTLDASIISAFAGLMLYAVGGTALKPMGVVLFFGAVFVLLINLLIFKLLMYLVTNSTNLQSNYAVFNIDGEKVPNILSVEEKPAYEAPYEKVDFTKKKTIIGGVFGALFAGALACIIAFGVSSSTKSPLNVEKAVSDKTVIYTSIKADSETPLVSDAHSFVEYVLPGTEDYLDLKTIESSIDSKKVSQYIYEDEEHNKTDVYYYFTIELDKEMSEADRNDLQSKIEDNLIDRFDASTEELTYVIVRNSHELVYTPVQGWVALATGLSIVGAALYCAFRFRPSRGAAMFVVTTGVTTIAYGVVVALRFIGTTAVTSLAMPVVAVTTLFGCLFYFATEKSALKEGNLVLTPELRKEIMVKSLGKSASALFIFMLISIYVVINFFGFGLENTSLLFASAIIGEILAVIVLLSVLGPLSSAFEKLFSKIRLPKFKAFAKEKANKAQVQKRNSSEPEETIFIGIND